MSEFSGEVVMLGTGTSHGVPMVGCRCPVCLSENPKNNRTRSSILVRAPQGNFVVDTTPELRIQLLRESVDLVHAALFTHAHADHIYGLDDLRQFGHLLDREIPLYCEENVEQQIRQSFAYAFAELPSNRKRGAIPRFEFKRVTSTPFHLLGLTIQPVRLLHGQLPVFGYRFANIAYCTDVSEIPEESFPLLENLDILILDALRYREHPTHFNITQAIEAVERIRPQRAYFTHLTHEIDHDRANRALPENISFAWDGLKIPFSLSGALSNSPKTV